MRKIQILIFRIAMFLLFLTATSDSLKATCTTPTVTSTTPGSRCGYGTVTLGATASAGTINWYTNSTGGASLGTGNSFTTPNISSTTTYYAEPGTSSTSTDSVGSRSSTSSTVSVYRALSSGRSEHIQLLFRASELTTAGFTAGNISAVTWYVTALGTNTYSSFTIGMANTASTAFSGSSGLADALTTVYTAASTTTPVAGPNTYTFTNSFNWDGTSNLLVNICAAVGTVGSASTVAINSPGFNGYMAGTTSCSNSAMSLNASRPLTSFTHVVNCTGSRSAVTATIDTAGMPIVYAFGNSPVCQGGDINLAGAHSCYNCTPTSYSWTGPNGFSSTDTLPVITNAPMAAGGTYTFSADNNGCTSMPSTVAIAITPPPAVVISPANPSFCLGSNPITLNILPGTLPTYCAENISFPCIFSSIGGLITNVTFGAINRSSTCDNNSTGYSIFTSPNPILIPGNTYTLSISYTTGTGSEVIAAYIDFNHNGVLNDAGEIVLTPTTVASGSGTVTATVTIPQNCILGAAMLRCKITNSSTAVVPCVSTTVGEVEDYYVTLGSASYTWAPPTGLNTTTGASVQASPSSTTTYTVTATDNNTGCTATVTTTFTVISPMTLTFSNTNVTCNGLSNGSASVTVSGGASSYTYNWSNGASSTSASITNNLSNLAPGTYSVTVTSGNCSAFQSGIVVSQPPAYSVSKSVTHVSCNAGSDGSITVSVSGNTPPYSYSWTNGATTSSITNLNANAYLLTITDSHGCSFTTSAQVTQPPSLGATATTTPVSCNGGSNGTASVSASGGTPPYNGTGTHAGLTAGTYTFIVTDSRGCTTAASAITITEPSAVTASGSVVGNVSCPGGSNGSASVSASGGTAPYSGTGTFSGLTAGSYTYIVTDNNGCTGSTTVVITQPSAINISLGSNTPVCVGSPINLTSSASGGTGAFSYAWTGPNSYSAIGANASIASATTLNTGSYLLTVTDANGCSATTTTTVSVYNCHTLLNLVLFSQGYYIGSRQMQPVLFNQGVCNNCFTQTDTIIVELHNTTSPYGVVQSVQAMLMVDGTALATFGPAVAGNSYYIAIRHRNMIQTWSAAPYAFTATGSAYNFSTAATQAYGNNMILVDVSPDLWAFYTGDINNGPQDENIDLIDFPNLDFGINQGLFGYYASDLNGDGNVDLLDFPVIDGNINAGIFSRHP